MKTETSKFPRLKKFASIFRTAPAQSAPAEFTPQASETFRFGPVQNTRPAGGKSSRGLARYYKQLILDHWALRQNMRSSVHDSPQARLILRRSVDVTIGNGLKLDPTPSFEMLGMTREDAERWAEDVKQKFNLWAKSKSSDLTGINNFYQNMRMYAWQYGRDGEVYVRFHYSKDPTLLNPLQISFIDPNQIRGDEFTFSLGPSVQNDGIIRDENSKEAGYKVWITDPEQPGRFKNVKIPAVDKKTGLPLMIHGFDPEYAGQTRGMPEMSHALQDFEKMTSFDVATLEKMINSANLNFTVKNALQDPSDMDLSTLNEGTAGVTVEAETPPSEIPTPIGAETVTVQNIPESKMSEPGTNLLSARQGDELVLIKTEQPGETSNDYIVGKFNTLAAAQSMAPEVVKMLFTNSHAASRASMGFQAQSNKIKVDDIASDFLDFGYAAWFAGEVALGKIRAPGFSDPVLRAAWLAHSWKGHPLPDVDPHKTRQAVNEAVKGGLTDLDTEAINYNGSDGKANRAKLARQIPELTPYPVEEPVEEPEPPDEDNQ